MEQENFILFLFFHLAAATMIIGCQFAVGVSLLRLLAFGIMLTTVGLVAHLGFSYNEETPFLQDVANRLLVRRDLRDLIICCWGFATAVPWIFVSLSKQSFESNLKASGYQERLKKTACIAGLVYSLFAIAATVANDVYPELLRGPALTDTRFEIEVIGDLPSGAVSMTTNAHGKVFVAYESFKDGREGGGIIAFEKGDGDAEWSQSTVTGGPCNPLLARPYGLATKGNDVYVSRSGRFIRATADGIVAEATGSVTRMTDTDGDGSFDQYEDIVTGLPGLQLPDSQHSNNGIVFDNEGQLYVLIGSPGDRHLPEFEFEGTVVRYSPDFTKAEVFAEGFRNPFGVAINPNNDSLFVCDQDVAANPGDEINHVFRDAHYGHPFITTDEDSNATGFEKPIFIGPREGNLAGIAFVTGEKLPASCRDTLFVAQLTGDKILKLDLTQDEGGKYTVKQEKVFARIRRPVAIAAGENGDLFIATREPDNRVYRVYLKPEYQK